VHHRAVASLLTCLHREHIAHVRVFGEKPRYARSSAECVAHRNLLSRRIALRHCLWSIPQLRV
jgi:hypothetical protein